MAEPVVRCTYTKLVPIAELKAKFHPKNPNVHPDDQLDRLAEIIRYQGIRKAAVLSNRSDRLTAGHGRIVAAERAGAKVYPVDCQDYENEEQEFADLVADNALNDWSDLNLSAINSELPNLGPDFDLDMLGIKDFTLEPADILEPQCDEDEVPEAADTRVKRGDVWQLGRHRLMCGDSTAITDVEKLMAGETADMVWTDPPYNVALGMESKEEAVARNRRTDGLTVKNDKLSNEGFLQLLCDVFSSAFLQTKDGGAIYISYPDRESKAFHNAFIDSGWKLSGVLVWVKSALVMGRSDYHSRHEPIIYGWKPGAAHQWLGDRSQSTVLEFDKPSRNAEHPTMKPVELVEYCISNNVKSNQTVLDLFGGSGSTLIACEKTNRRCFMMEIDPHYCDVILARWEKYTGKTAERLEEGANV